MVDTFSEGVVIILLMLFLSFANFEELGMDSINITDDGSRKVLVIETMIYAAETNHDETSMEAKPYVKD